MSKLSQGSLLHCPRRHSQSRQSWGLAQSCLTQRSAPTPWHTTSPRQHTATQASRLPVVQELRHLTPNSSHKGRSRPPTGTRARPVYRWFPHGSRVAATGPSFPHHTTQPRRRESYLTVLSEGPGSAFRGCPLRFSPQPELGHMPILEPVP